jgi:hypothetical protein
MISSEQGGTHEGPEWVSIPEAAEITGRSIGTLLTWCRENLVVSQLSPGADGDTRMVRVDEVLRLAGSRSGNFHHGEAGSPSPITATSASTDLAPLIAALPDLLRELGDARERAARAETKVEFLQERLAELRSINSPESRLQTLADTPSSIEGEALNAPTRRPEQPEPPKPSELVDWEVPAVRKDEESTSPQARANEGELKDVWRDSEVGGFLADEPLDWGDERISEPRRRSRWRRRGR